MSSHIRLSAFSCPEWMGRLTLRVNTQWTASFDSLNMASVGDVVLPGDPVTCFGEVNAETKVLIGPGLRQESNRVIAVKPGILTKGQKNTYWIDSHEKRYIPVKGDTVIGIVTAKTAEGFKLDIGGSEHASLSFLAFEGASKQNRPDVAIDDIVYARLLLANKDMEPELVCIDGTGKSRGLGVLRGGGFLLRTSVSHARRMLQSDSLLSKTVGKTLPFEFAVGLNGRIWINGRSTQETIEIVRRISDAEALRQ